MVNEARKVSNIILMPNVRFFQFCTYAAKIKLISDIPQDVQDTQDVQDVQVVQDAQTSIKTTEKLDNKTSTQEIAVITTSKLDKAQIKKVQFTLICYFVTFEI